MKKLSLFALMLTMLSSMFATNVGNNSIINNTRELTPPTNFNVVADGNDVNISWLSPTSTTEDHLQSFEAETFPEDWDMIHTGTEGEHRTWYLAGITSWGLEPSDGAQMMHCNWGSHHQDEWVISPEYSNIESVTFDYYCGFGSNNGEDYCLKVSSDNGETWTEVWNAADLPTSTGCEWRSFDVDLTAYAATPVKLGWQVNDNGDGGLTYSVSLDKVNIITTASSDDDTDTLTGYKIFRDDAEIASLESDVLAYADEDIEAGQHTFYMKAVYNDAVSEATDTVTVNIDAIVPPTNVTTTIEGASVWVTWFAPANARTLDGYKIYRDDVELAFVETGTMSYYDYDLANGTYNYKVTAMYGDDESEPSDIATATLAIAVGNLVIEDSFEDYEDFSIEFDNWINTDVDGCGTTGVGFTDYPNKFDAKAFMVFNPANTTPPSDEVAHDGDKFLVCFSSYVSQDVESPNNDWLISKKFMVTGESSLNFFTESIAPTSPDHFNVLVSTGSTNPEDFVCISGNSPVQAPRQWDVSTYSLNDYENQTIRIAIQCVSNDSYGMKLDELKIVSDGVVSNDNNNVTPVAYALANYPNPFNPETTISYNLPKAGNVNINIYNILGQKVKSLVNENQVAGTHTTVWNGTDDNNAQVSSGVYFYKMTSGKYNETKKMVLLK